MAGSATWRTNPASGDWNTAANWTPAVIPNDPTDIATFGTSSVTQVSLSADTATGSLVFNPGASSYTFLVSPSKVDRLDIFGDGITNNSGVAQNFLATGLTGLVLFYNQATAGSETIFTNSGGGQTSFFDDSNAGEATLIINGGQTAVQSGGLVTFSARASANHGSFFNQAAPVADYVTPEIDFYDDSSAGSATFTNSTSNSGGISRIYFNQRSTAAEGVFSNQGGATGNGSIIAFDDGATAGNATLTNEGGTGAEGQGASLTFASRSSAGTAYLIAEGGSDGGSGGEISFVQQSDGGTARVQLAGNATLDISGHNSPGVTIGSLSGAGSVILGGRNLSVGSNDLNTTFTGVIQGSGSLTKLGEGVFTLGRPSTYFGTTTVSSGSLRVANETGSATGTGMVLINLGTLGGKGIIDGAVVIGGGAFLEPSVGASQPTTLTIQSALTFKSDSTYTYKLNTKKAKADQIVANGVTIESGAQFDLVVVANKKLSAGTVFTAISNTAATPIAGAFANLADGSTLIVGRNSYQVSYSSGDGNDLTLTVAP